MAAFEYRQALEIRGANLLRRCIKDPFPGLSHWMGMALSVAGLALLLVLSAGRPVRVTACVIYGTTLIVLYAASALAHTVHCSPRAAERLTRFDYVAIFLLIAGTYTPLCLVALPGPWGWGMLAAEWGMAAFGAALVVCGRGQSNWPRTVLYLFMAWIVGLVGIGPIWRALPAPTLAWLLAGGVVYSTGAIVFATDRPHLCDRFMAHDLWHLLVLAGSACHFIAVAQIVAR